MQIRATVPMRLRGAALGSLASLLLLASCGNRDEAGPPETARGAGDAAARAAVDPDDERAYGSLAEELGVERVAPEPYSLTRGGAAGLVLLWPRDEVRLEGLTSFAIEADDAYDGTGYVEFRKGSKVLWRSPAPFEGAQEVNLASMPPEVVGAVKPGDEVTWTLDLGPRNRGKAPKASFKVVKEPKVEKQIARIRGDKRLDRQAAGTRELLVADALLSHRLYTEALLENLAIARAHPEWMRPFQGIVTALRRLGLTDSSLWDRLAPRVGGAGKYAPERPAGSAPVGAERTGKGGLADVVSAYVPSPGVAPAVGGEKPTVAKDASGTPEGAPATPPGPAGVPVAPEPGAKVGGDLAEQARTAERVLADAREQKDRLEEALRETEKRFLEAQEAARAAEVARDASVVAHQEAVAKVVEAAEKVKSLQGDPAKRDELAAAEKELEAANKALAEAEAAAMRAAQDAHEASKTAHDAARAAEAARVAAGDAVMRLMEAMRHAQATAQAFEASKAGGPEVPPDALRDAEEKRRATEAQAREARARLEAAHLESQAAVKHAQASESAARAALEKVEALRKQVEAAAAAHDAKAMEEASRELAEAEAALAEANREAAAASEALEQARKNAVDAYRRLEELTGAPAPPGPAPAK